MTNSVDFANSRKEKPIKRKKRHLRLPLFNKEAVTHQRERLYGDLMDTPWLKLCLMNN